jgi:hypothetical protein
MVRRALIWLGSYLADLGRAFGGDPDTGELATIRELERDDRLPE